MEIELRKINKRFGDTQALDDVSLRIRDGELMGILGPSGSGKTTLIRVIAGLEKPDSGRVLFDGEDVTNLPPEKRNVGMVFQNYALFPHMNVEENIGFGLMVRRKSMPEIRKRVEELLKLVGLEGYNKRRIDQLSGGEMQRVALARALAPGIGILLLDEPLSALDARLRDSLKKEIRRIQRETGITALYVTHDQREALSISDRVAVMNSGRIEQVGTPDEIYFRPETEFVARFVGDGNILEGKVKDREIITPLGSISMDSNFKGECKVLIRPESIHFQPMENSLELSGRILETESAGGEVQGIIDVGGTRLIFRRYAREMAEIKESASIWIPLDSIHIIGERDEAKRNR